MNYTRDNKKTFKVQDLINMKPTCHREKTRYKNNSYTIYK